MRDHKSKETQHSWNKKATARRRDLGRTHKEIAGGGAQHLLRKEPKK